LDVELVLSGPSTTGGSGDPSRPIELTERVLVLEAAP
jgi:hypothetical protein